MTNYLAAAIKKLKPTAQFSFSDNDYSTIRWDILEGDAPTQFEIDEMIELIKIEETNAINAQKLAKQSAMDKLTALGLTSDEVAALLP